MATKVVPTACGNSCMVTLVPAFRARAAHPNEEKQQVALEAKEKRAESGADHSKQESSR